MKMNESLMQCCDHQACMPPPVTPDSPTYIPPKHQSMQAHAVHMQTTSNVWSMYMWVILPPLSSISSVPAALAETSTGPKLPRQALTPLPFVCVKKKNQACHMSHAGRPHDSRTHPQALPSSIKSRTKPPNAPPNQTAPAAQLTMRGTVHEMP
eukprot:CAMPEP_0202866920 /NCGR_PEP_ID=MMETSP1391-20130828/8431_1 /ASSEMBLY_ACC=CAM_ASM_000867 /TAXON_ID=1034604 /ORGANISM="Chlamydomonas leiostraca, Strain SAG 11-49" /LENGTH=152 /DNA_ID=CAMNT_0049546909 /DNA_START=106 /DNA_END=564 /DNA_ORIENTATION=+